MTITATDFQLSVNEYFTRLMKGEEIIIERYGKKFAVLVPYDEYLELVKEGAFEQSSVKQVSNVNKETLSEQELLKLVKKLLND